MKRHLQMPTRRGQRGVIAIIVGLTLVVMVGFAGLALDGGRLYVNKTELQNAADACALSASFELTGTPNIPLANFPIANDAGRLVATRNRVGFQGADIAGGDVTVEFGATLNGSFVDAGAATANSKYVRCTIQETGITPWFMQVLGIGDQTVRSLATASLVPSENPCTAIPIGLCTVNSTPPNYGLVPGQWYCSLFDGGACPPPEAGPITGNFGWIDFSPPAGGASELMPLLSGSGVCTVGAGAPIAGDEVGAPGAMTALLNHWNTRFGVYRTGAPGIAGAVPDRSGYAYTPTNWPSTANALPDFLANKRPANLPYGATIPAGNTATGLSLANATVRQAAQLAATGASRRIVPVPIVNCAGYVGGSTTPLIDWACVFMLNPVSQTGPAPKTMRLEYIGLASATDSPCASVGGIGNSASTGPLVPGLVQ